MNKRSKKFAALLAATIMVLGSTMGVYAGSNMESWSVNAYPSQPDSGTLVIYTSVIPTYKVTCSSYASPGTTPITFSCSNFGGNVYIYNVSTHTPAKKDKLLNKSFSVTYKTAPFNQVTASGRVEG